MSASILFLGSFIVTGVLLGSVVARLEGPVDGVGSPVMRYLHTMIRVRDLPAAMRFFCDGLGLRELRRRDHDSGRYTLVFLGLEDGDSPQIELTYNWDQKDAYSGGRNFGHVAYEVDDIYAACQRLADMGYTINRPPRDGHMAFVRSPDAISVELLQRGQSLPPAEPWKSMANTGEW
jgi:lactoylglutathione lyase